MKTPVYTISGFLGAGKTTFVNGLLSRLADNVNVAIIVNELGEIAIDGRIIENKDYLLQEITEGCICCTLRAKLADALIAIVEDHAPDLILLETTGVARPKQIVSEFHLKRLSEKVFSKRIISFLDAVIYARVGHNMPIINFQLEDADVIILNKIDLVGPEDLSRVRDRLKSFTGGNKTIYETRHSKMEYDEIFPEMRGDGTTTTENPLRNSHEKDPFRLDHPLPHGHGFLNSTEGFATISLEAGVTITHDAMSAFFNRHQKKIIRAKGLLKMEKGNKVLHFSSSGLQMEDYNNGLNKSELVLIVKDNDRASLEDSIPDGFARRF
jgi:G3E family GTPase